MLSGKAIKFSKKWYYLDDYGVQTAKYSTDLAMFTAKVLPSVIDAIKEAQLIANQALAK